MDDSSYEVLLHTEQQLNAPHRPLQTGQLNDPDGMALAWSALLRLLERVAPGYRD